MAKWLQTYEHPFKLYHLSTTNLDGVEVVPRPLDKERAMEGEVWRPKRICVSSSIDGALASLDAPYNENYFVHVPENLESLFARKKVYKPSLRQVPDSGLTDEYWLKAPCKMVCIGEITTLGIVPNQSKAVNMKCRNGYGYYFIVDFLEWKWIAKFKPDLIQ